MSDAYDPVDATLRGWVAERDFAGIAAVRRAGVAEFEGCYDLANRADGVPVRPPTRTPASSCSRCSSRS